MTKTARTERHITRIRDLVENSPGEKVDVATLRQRADEKVAEYGDDSLHEALDQTEREIAQHNKTVLRNSKTPQPRTMHDANQRAIENRRRATEHFREEKRLQWEREATKSVPMPSLNPANAIRDSRVGKKRKRAMKAR